MCSDTRGATPVYRCTWAASAIFSNGSRGTPGCENTLNRVPELPNAQLGTSMVNSARPLRTLSARSAGRPPAPAPSLLSSRISSPVLRFACGLLGRAGLHAQRSRPGTRSDDTTPAGGQPLTAPAVMPDTILRLKKMNMISGGIVTSTMSMKSRLYCVLNWLGKL